MSRVRLQQGRTVLHKTCAATKRFKNPHIAQTIPALDTCLLAYIVEIIDEYFR